MERCPNCASLSVSYLVSSHNGDRICHQCNHQWWSATAPTVPSHGQVSMSHLNAAEEVPATALGLDAMKHCVNEMTASDRQALYGYMHTVHGCRMYST